MCSIKLFLVLVTKMLRKDLKVPKFDGYRLSIVEDSSDKSVELSQRAKDALKFVTSADSDDTLNSMYWRYRTTIWNPLLCIDSTLIFHANGSLFTFNEQLDYNEIRSVYIGAEEEPRIALEALHSVRGSSDNRLLIRQSNADVSVVGIKNDALVPVFHFSLKSFVNEDGDMLYVADCLQVNSIQMHLVVVTFNSRIESKRGTVKIRLISVVSDQVVEKQLWEYQDLPYKCCIGADGHSVTIIASNVLKTKQCKDKAISRVEAVTEPSGSLFSWTQSSEEVVIAVPAISEADRQLFLKKDANIVFNATKILFRSVTGLNIHKPLSERYTGKHPTSKLQCPFDHALHAEINPEASYWTIESQEDSYKLNIHLEKRHTGTRWTYLFESSEQSISNDILNVPETLDPSQLERITENLQKYTAPEINPQNEKAVGMTMKELAERANSLKKAQEWDQWNDLVESSEIEVPLDLDNESFAPISKMMNEEEDCDLDREPVVIQRIQFNNEQSAEILTTRLPGCSFLGLSADSESRIIAVQYDIDMVILDPAQFEGNFPKHIDTFPALGFVQASKTNKKVLTFTKSKTPKAFILDHRKVVYTFNHLEHWSDQHAEHSVRYLDSCIDGDLTILAHAQINDNLAILTPTHVAILRE